MRLISSDTSVWIDFSTIDLIETPFRLKDRYTFTMSGEAMDTELLTPEISADYLMSLGLVRVDLTETELSSAMAFGDMYIRLSFNDRIAMAIAKNRDMILLTSDGPLRKAAESEGIEVHGTIWIVDELKANEKISVQEYENILTGLLAHCGKGVRLPVNELQKRIDVLKNVTEDALDEADLYAGSHTERMTHDEVFSDITNILTEV